jgi:hypothetical protein
MTFFLTSSALREPLNPADAVPVRGGGQVAYYRFECSDLGGVDGFPAGASDFEPVFALPHIKTWVTSIVLKESATCVVELARLHDVLIGMALDASAQRFEDVVALQERLRLVAQDVVEGMRWRLRENNFERWPTERDLPSVNSRCKLWKFKSGDFRTPEGIARIELVNYFDAMETCSRELVAGDIIIPGPANPAWDVLVVVALDGGRLGLRCVECNYGATGAKNAILDVRKVEDKLRVLKSVYRDVLFTSPGPNAIAGAKVCWSKLPQAVRECDVALEFVVSGKMDHQLRTSSWPGDVRVLIKDAPLVMSTVLERLPMLRMKYLPE